MIGGAELSAEASILVCDNNTAATRGVSFIDKVFRTNARLLARFSKSVSIGIISHATKIDNAITWKDVLE
jgi:hypothetical protein